MREAGSDRTMAAWDRRCGRGSRARPEGTSEPPASGEPGPSRGKRGTPGLEEPGPSRCCRGNRDLPGAGGAAALPGRPEGEAAAAAQHKTPLCKIIFSLVFSHCKQPLQQVRVILN